MTCANKAYLSLFTMPASARWRRPVFLKALIVFVEAFQEALDMRRAAHRRYRLTDE
jgi:hypothetical protein